MIMSNMSVGCLKVNFGKGEGAGFEFDVTIFPVNQPFVFAYHKCIDFNCLRV